MTLVYPVMVEIPDDSELDGVIVLYTQHTTGQVVLRLMSVDRERLSHLQILDMAKRLLEEFVIDDMEPQGNA